MEKKKLLRLVPAVFILGMIGSMVAAMFGHAWLIGVIFGTLFGVPFLIGIVFVILSVVGVTGRYTAANEASAEEKARQRRDAKLISTSGYRKNNVNKIPLIVILCIIGCVAAMITLLNLGYIVAGVGCFFAIFVIVFSCAGIAKLAERVRSSREKDNERFAVVHGVVKACLIPTDEVIAKSGATYTDSMGNVAYNGMYKVLIETDDSVRAVFSKDIVAEGSSVRLSVNKRSGKTRIV